LAYVYSFHFLSQRLGKFPKAEYVHNHLVEAMKTPREDTKQPARRPKAIVFTSPLLFKELQPHLLNNHGVTAKLWNEDENQGTFNEDGESSRRRQQQQLGYETSQLYRWF
jgi:hypothetical protein